MLAVNFMNPPIYVRDSLPADVVSMRDKLRAEDAREQLALGVTPHRALWTSYKRCTMRKTAFVEGEIAAMWGVAGVTMGAVGQPFLLTTDAVKHISPLRFARIYQQEVLRMLEVFPKLVNYVHSDYTQAVRLLDIVGFTVSEPQHMGLEGVMFQRFEMVRK